ncbi:MAG: DUF4838 domain-containing protein [Armatimonadetes bacterium]|nr:DUF4838 domain-containing protein [Armatimonadota bacterium]
MKMASKISAIFLLFAAINTIMTQFSGESFTIVVNFGRHATAYEAGFNEANTNWQDEVEATICTEAFAACELQSYLQKITGKKFKIADDDKMPTGNIIIVGSPSSNRAAKIIAPSVGISQKELKGLGQEGYIIKSVRLRGRRVVVIAGSERVGTLYGVYDFLHRLGVRWYAPDEIGEEVVQRELIDIPDLDVRESPKFLLRGFHAWEDRADENFIIWMARNRLNYWCVEQSQKPLLRKLGIKLVGGGHILTYYYLNPRSPYPYNHPIFIGDEDKPKDPYQISTDYMGDANNDGKLCYFEAHPEWFALIKGKRSDNIRGDSGDNFCTSHEDALREWMKNAINDLAEGRYKDADLINAWTLDGGRWCECRKCIALGSPTDRYLLLVHRFAQEIKGAKALGRIKRKIRLLFLVYADVLQPPTKPLPKDFDYEMCIATFFPIVRCYVHSFSDKTCPTNSRYSEILQSWAVKPDRYYRGQICIGEYYNVSGYKCLPVCYMSTMSNDIPYYYHIGARYFHYMHVKTREWGTMAFTNWQMARQLWNPETDCKTLWDDYFHGRYGEAQSLMRQFYEYLEKALCNVSELKYGLARRLSVGSKDLFPSPHLRYDPTDEREKIGPTLKEILVWTRHCREKIDMAKLMALPKKIKLRIEEDERLFTYAERTLKFYDALCRAYFSVRGKNINEAKKALEEAKFLAELLRSDTTSAKFSSSHANANNALEASFAAGALNILSQLIAAQ